MKDKAILAIANISDADARRVVLLGAMRVARIKNTKIGVKRGRTGHPGEIPPPLETPNILIPSDRSEEKDFS
jgi:hypothetical protein